jgi:hypothetical protein
MSELPEGLRELLAEAKLAHEPDPARLQAVYRRVLDAPRIPDELEALPQGVPEVSTGLRLPWGSLLAAGALAVSGWWLSAAPQGTAPAVPPAPEVPMSSTAAPRVEPSGVGPSSDWPVASRAAPVAAPSPPAQVEPAHVEAAPPVDVMSAPEPSARVRKEAPLARAPRPVDQVSEPARSEAIARERPEVPPPNDPKPSESKPWGRPGSTTDEGDYDDATDYDSPVPTIVTRKVDPAVSLRDEVRLIGLARNALERGHWQLAERALDEHQLAHPLGQLHVERHALLARVRCLAGDLASARRLHADLQDQAPGSSLLCSLERACPALAP